MPSHSQIPKSCAPDRPETQGASRPAAEPVLSASGCVPPSTASSDTFSAASCQNSPSRNPSALQAAEPVMPEEILDLVDPEGNPMGLQCSRSMAHQWGYRHRTSHVWICRKHHGHVQLLLQKRAAHKDAFPGCYDISSAGHIPARVDFIPSALRELKEELGLDVQADQLTDCGNRTVIHDAVFYGKPFIDRQISKVFLLRLPEDASPAMQLQASEVESVRWMDLEDVMTMVQTGSKPHCIAMEELEMLIQAGL